MVDWPQVLWITAVVFAVGGGISSTAAFLIRRRDLSGDAVARLSHVLYLLSYILMSLSIFFIALRGLIH